MRGFSLIWMALCWCLWGAPFVIRVLKRRDAEPVETASRALWGVLLQAVAYSVAWFPQRGWTNSPPLPMTVASMIIGPISVLIAWFAVRHLGKQWRVEAGLNRDHDLVRTGPYSAVRHPIYLSMFGVLLTTALLLDVWWQIVFAATIFIIGTEIRVREEDKLLEGRFGESFRSFKARVPAYLPFVR